MLVSYSRLFWPFPSPGRVWPDDVFLSRISALDGPTRSPAKAAAASGAPAGGEGIQLSTKLYVGNLSFSTTEAELQELFEKHGTLSSVKVITDRETGRSRGFGFVEFEDASSADEAQKALNGQQLGGRDLRVNEAHDKRGGGGDGGGGYR